MTAYDESEHARNPPPDANWDSPPALLDSGASTAVPAPPAGDAETPIADAALAHAAVIGAALVCWVAAVSGTNLRPASGHGLLAALPPTYYAGLALLAVGYAIAASRRNVQPAVLGSYVVALVVVLHATAAWLYPGPGYAWTDKHLGVIEYVARQRSIDVYTAWTQLAFELANVAVLLFALRGVTRAPRLQWTTVWLFVAASWIGPYDPAPFLLVTVVIGLVLRCGPVQVRGGRPPLEPIQPPPVDTRAAVVVGALCSVVVIVSDPPSAAVLILSVGALTVMTGRPPPWVVAGLIAVAAPWTYLSPDVLTEDVRFLGIDIALPAQRGSPGLTGATGIAAIVVLLGPAAVGLARRWRAGRHDVAALTLAAAALAVLGVESFDGEARLQAYVFALPWLAFYVAAACHATAVRGSWRLLSVTVLLGTATLLGAAGLDLGTLRVALGLPIALIAPGWLLLRATVGRRLGSGHAAALTVPLSLAICALSGTVLTLAGVRLTTLSLTLVVCAGSLACLLVAMAHGTVVPSPAMHWPSAQRVRLTPRTALAGGLAIAILAVGASTVRAIVRIGDAARASTPFVALTGELQQATPIAGGARVRVAFTVINSQPRAIRPRLEISVLPGQTTPVRRTLAIGSESQASVQEALVARCGDEVVARLTGDGVPARRAALRIACPG